MTFDLQLGAIDLLATANTSPGYWFETYGDDLDLGSPEAVETAITSFLQDGSIAVIEKYDNRTMTLPVAVCGTTAANLAAGESALVAEVGGRNQLTYTPSGNGSACVFDVVNSKLAHNADDILELNAKKRVYSLTVEALPFARAAAETAFSWAAPPAGAPTVTVVDACTSTTGWARTNAGTGVTFSGPTVVGGAVNANAQNTSGSSHSATLTLTRTGLSASMTTTPFVRVDYSGARGNPSMGIAPVSTFVSVTINGTLATEVASNGTVHWYAMPGGATTLTSIAFSDVEYLPNNVSLALTINDISRSSASSDVTGQRQAFRSVTVAGSARTQPTLALSDATPASLGSVLVYTAPNSVPLAQPNLRVRRSAGGTETTDTSTISGKTSVLSASLESFDTTANQCPPGSYTLLARIKHASAATYPVTAAAYSVLGSNVLGTIAFNTVSVTLAAATYKIVNVGQFVLPTVQMGSTGIIRVALSSTASGLVLDEAWLFNTDVGRLTWVECGTGTPAAGGSASVLFLSPASLVSPTPSVSIGTATDGSDAYDAGAVMQSFGDHEFAPGVMNIFTASSNSVALAGSGTYPPRFMTHVA